MIKSIAFILFFINLFPSAARDIYVSVSNGLDTNDGSKPTKALQTLQAAADMTRPGDTVWVDFGVYQSKAKEILRIRNSGSEKKWIVYKNISENKPILKIHYDAGIFLESVSYISIEGFEITQDVDWYGRKYLGADPDFVTSTGNGIVCPRVSQLSKISHHIKIQDCEIHSCPGSGIFLQCADYLTIQFNHIHHNGEMNLTNNSGIRLQQLVEFDQKEGIHNLINGNTVHHQRRSSRLEEEISFCEKTYSGSGISVRDNRYFLLEGTTKAYHQNIQISNNVLHNNAGIGLDIIETDQIKVIHNTSFRNNRNSLVNCGELYIKNSNTGIVANNIFYANQDKKASQIINYERFEITNNMYFNSLQFARGQKDFVADPMFVKANNFETVFDFHLKSKSPAIDSGSKAHTTGYDHAGGLRLSGTQVDIGAFEFSGSRPLQRNFKPASVDERSVKLFWQAGYSEATEQILISNQKGRIFSARLFNGRGQLVNQLIQNESSFGGIEFETSELPRGWYYVVAYNDHEKFFHRYYVK
ncbi:MAG: right-handed parallel beta-helix repeat-containing protein [Saprospiraceae bacterium]|nr:right-handed parallel beta-helix repeat-containing protein [Saprospiraceae bacterium]MBK7811690.1 right-handed parallel beta-helix repeat-containing protein [Saprospiraceae bacterium]